MKEHTTTIGSTIIKFIPQTNGVSFESSVDDKLLLINLNAEEAEQMLRKNYAIVYPHYKAIALNQLNETDLQQACFKIVVFYFYLYNLWRAIYENQKDRDLNFLISDFDHPYTFDKIREFFIRKYPDSYAEKCAVMLGMRIDAFKEYEQRREDLYDMW